MSKHEAVCAELELLDYDIKRGVIKRIVTVHPDHPPVTTSIIFSDGYVFCEKEN